MQPRRSPERPEAIDTEAVEAATLAWVERVVIGLHLCPFAAPSIARGGLRTVVSGARTAEGVARDVIDELIHLQSDDGRRFESSLLVLPVAFADFAGFNAFLAVCEAIVEDLGLVGVFQIASFHPDYRFADAPPGDAADYTNRSPFPMLHLLRECAVAHAIREHPDPEDIPRRNASLLRRLGSDAIRRLLGDAVDSPSGARAARGDPA